MQDKQPQIRLAVDTHHLLLEHAGTKRITVNVLEEIRKRDSIKLLEFKPRYLVTKKTGVLSKILGHFIRFIWVHVHLPVLCFRYKADLLLSPEFNTPFYTPCKRVVIVPDAHMKAQKEYTSKFWFYLYYLPLIESAIRKADLIITISKFAKKQIVELMRVKAERVHVTYLGVDSHFFKSRTAEEKLKDIAEQGLKYKNYILFVGTFEARKNIERLLEAFALIKKEYSDATAELKLAIVGQPSSGMFSDRSRQIRDLIEHLNLKQDVILCGFVSDSALPGIYEGACMVAFPSLHEGFGLPIIEGFVSRVPVLTSNLCSMPEIAGDAAAIVDPFNVNDIYEKMRDILFNKTYSENLIQSGLRRVKCFTWERCTDQILSHITSLLKK